MAVKSLPPFIQVTLGFVREVTAASAHPRPDIVALLAETLALPDRTIVQISKERAGILVDEGGNPLSFT